jgi:lipid-A-disaccharide synthase
LGFREKQAEQAHRFSLGGSRVRSKSPLEPGYEATARGFWWTGPKSAELKCQQAEEIDSMPKILVVAGEASGDLHAGHLFQEWRSLNPNLTIWGTGGEKLSAAGARLLYSVDDLAVIGFSEVIREYGFIKKVFQHLVDELDRDRPDAVLLVDYPGFNLRFAAEVKKRDIPVVYYIAPQVWAWKKNRVRTMKALVDHLIVLFPFEVDFFNAEGMTAHCFGHPLLDIVKPSMPRRDWLIRQGLDPERQTICLLPGSRRNEIRKHLPLLLETLDHLVRKRSDYQFVYPLAPTFTPDTIAPLLGDHADRIRWCEHQTYDALSHADFAVVASGTATLETAILQTPLVIIYKTTLATYLIGKYLLGIKAIGLPNIIAGTQVVPEDPRFINPGRLAKIIGGYLDDPTALAQMRGRLRTVKEKLGTSGAYRRTAVYLDALFRKTGISRESSLTNL